MANYSQINVAQGAAVKTADDLWLVRGGNLVPAMSAWAVKNGALVKVWERQGGATSMVWNLPVVPITRNVNTPITFAVTVSQNNHVARPEGVVRFTFSNGTVLDGTINAVGVAEVTITPTVAGTLTCTATLVSSNGFTAAAIVREATIVGGRTTLTFTSPADQQVFYGEQNITWTVRANPINSVAPQGTIKFTGPGGSQYVTLDANGYASATFYHAAGQKGVIAELTTSSNGYTADAIGRTIRLLTNQRFQQEQWLNYEGHRNYAGANGGPQSASGVVSGDSSGTSWRAFTRNNVPVKPVGHAYCVDVRVIYNVSWPAAGVRVGWHSLGSYPSTGTFSQNGVHQNLMTGPGTTGNDHWLDMSLHLAAAMNDGSFRGLVFGGPSGQTPYSILAGNTPVRVIWEWYSWTDT